MTNKKIRSISESVALPDGGVIAISYGFVGEEDKIITIYDHNHNIFRLDRTGNVIWQVQREELGKIRWDLIMANIAKKGEEATRFSRIPFGELWLEDIEGKRFQSDVYISGCKLIALAAGGRNYEVNIETGVAINIDEPGGRLW